MDHMQFSYSKRIISLKSILVFKKTDEWTFEDTQFNWLFRLIALISTHNSDGNIPEMEDCVLTDMEIFNNSGFSPCRPLYLINYKLVI